MIGIETFEELGGTIVRLQNELEIERNQPTPDQIKIARLIKQLDRAEKGMEQAKKQAPKLPGFEEGSQQVALF